MVSSWFLSRDLGRVGAGDGARPARQHEEDRLEYMTIDGDEKQATYQRTAVDYEIRPADMNGSMSCLADSLIRTLKRRSA
jgi:hypothetical protein